ncbi:MAG: autotransporter outer membrane beta-barrel domain-containing protein [Sutterella sp.]|nr:autotransporter outer membrane beta-barrel domain-containing protein [Sutterella sp.]
MPKTTKRDACGPVDIFPIGKTTLKRTPKTVKKAKTPKAPVGVTFSAAFEQAGWKFAPMVDLSVVPAFGDKDAVVEIGSAREALRVVDTNPIQATIGLSAETGAWTFGVHYGLTAGGDDRLNNAFNATAKYAF